MSTIGIIQSNFFPWRGYFDFIQEVDTFIVLEDVQYTKRDWRNRNRFKLRDGTAQWLSVPVVARRETKINEAKIDYTQDWPDKAVNFLQHNYSKTPFFKEYFGAIREILLGNDELLVDLNFKLINLVCTCLEIDTKLLRSPELDGTGSREIKLINLVKSVNGKKYLSGSSAQDYIVAENWRDNNIELNYKNYSGYPDYPQVAEPFVPDVSIIDLLFMKGDAAPDYIWGKYRVTN